MTRLEDALRETFAGRVAEQPIVLDPAGKAIRRARVVRRRRRANGAAALAIATLLAGGVLRFGGAGDLWQRVTNRPSGPVPGTRLDMWRADQLWTADGKRFTLPGDGQVRWVEAVPAGWLYGTSEHKVRMLNRYGVLIDPIADADSVVVSLDGSRIAWKHYFAGGAPGQLVFSGMLGPTGVTGREMLTTTQVDAVVGIVGNHVILRADNQPHSPVYDFWTPGENFEPTWNDEISAVLGEYTGGAVGLAYGDATRAKTCVARLALDPGGIHPHEKACVGPGSFIGGRISPDGRWLAIGTGSAELLIDLSTVFQDPGAVVQCPNSVNPSDVFWEDARHVVLLTGPGAWGRCGVDGTITQVPFPAPANAWTVVVRPG